MAKLSAKDFIAAQKPKGSGRRRCANHAAELITMLESEYALMQQVSHATRVGSRRWNLLLKQGIDIRLPAEHAQIAWRYLATLQRKHKILQKKIRAVDLRIPNRLTLQVLKTKRPAQEGGAT